MIASIIGLIFAMSVPSAAVSAAPAPAPVPAVLPVEAGLSVPLSVPVDSTLQGKAGCAPTMLAQDDGYDFPPECELVNQFGDACVIRCPTGLFLVLCNTGF